MRQPRFVLNQHDFVFLNSNRLLSLAYLRFFMVVGKVQTDRCKKVKDQMES